MATPKPTSPWFVRMLGAFLLFEAVSSAIALIYLFPPMPAYVAPTGFGWLIGADAQSLDRNLLLLALFSGALGSTLHTMQSFAAFAGDRKLETSWFWWYVLRAPVGAILGFLIYVATRGGVLSLNVNDASTAINPYGVIAIASLAGWFSKKATDKLAEVFDILFRTARETEFTGKLHAPKPPVIDTLDPSSLPAAEGGPLKIVGKEFSATAQVLLDDQPLAAIRDADGNLGVIIPPGREPGDLPLIVVQSPAADAPRSAPVTLTLT